MFGFLLFLFVMNGKLFTSKIKWYWKNLLSDYELIIVSDRNIMLVVNAIGPLFAILLKLL